jgi:hypothetical protein
LLNLETVRTFSDLVQVSVNESGAFEATIAGREEQAEMLAYADYGVPWTSGSCGSESGLADIAAYRALVTQEDCSAWMDNTTIVTAVNLMSSNGPEVMTPLTVWDLATFVRAIVCYERIYHHNHPAVKDEEINGLLGDDVLVKINLPTRYTGNNILPDPWDGAHRFMCDVWFSAEHWMKRLTESAGTDSLDGKQLEGVAAAWRQALGVDDLQAAELVDHKDVDRRWRSPSNQLLVDTANITQVDDTRIYLDPREEFQRVFKMKREAGIHDESKERRSQLLSDLNLRGYVNQRLAEFFSLPYACSAARLPFRRSLHDQQIKIQQELVAAEVIDRRYAELSNLARLRLPIFLALALRGAKEPDDLWFAVMTLRDQATGFRAHRKEIDEALARGDLKVAKKLSEALNTSVEGLLELAGNVTTAAGGVVVQNLVKGDLNGVRTGIGAALAATKGVIKSSFAKRLLWRLHKPQLLWMNNLVDQAHHLTEALPDFSRVWSIPPNRQADFIQRFRCMAQLGE